MKTEKESGQRLQRGAIIWFLGVEDIHYSDYKCESYGKSFSGAGVLKKHIQTLHEGTKITNLYLVVILVQKI